jgi:hypothetical protein
MEAGKVTRNGVRITSEFPHFSAWRDISSLRNTRHAV